MKLCIIMRGLPGSGKSTLAREIVAKYPGALIFSADDFFKQADGTYKFDVKLLHQAHMKCWTEFTCACLNKVPVVIVDNTNVRLRDIKPYVQIAGDHGYEVQYQEPTTPWAWDIDELVKRNTHGVGRDIIERMQRRYARDLSPLEVWYHGKKDVRGNVLEESEALR